MLFSVIIPTYKSWDTLKFCLEALEKQSISQDQFEVIVIDNDCSEEVTLDTTLKNFQLLKESKAGSYAARNKGIKFAKGNIIAFTDSDCIPDVNWLINAHKMFNEDPNLERIAGEVQLFIGESTLAAKEYEQIFTFNTFRNFKRGQAVTANCIVKRSVFDKVGYFDDDLFSGGDVKWNRDATLKGITLAYSEKVIVQHPTRKFWEIIKKSRRTYPQQLDKLSNPLFKVLNGFRFLAPPLRDIKRLKGKNLNFLEKIDIIKIIMAVRIAKLFEHFKLLIGFDRVRD